MDFQSATTEVDCAFSTSLALILQILRFMMLVAWNLNLVFQEMIIILRHASIYGKLGATVI